MATLTTLLLGAAAGAAGTWAYLRRQKQVVEVLESPTVAPAVQAEETVEGNVVDATAASN